MNQKTFRLNLISGKTFSLQIYGLTQILTWLEKITMKFGGAASMTVGFGLSKNIQIINSIVVAMKQLRSVSSNIINDLEMHISTIHSSSKIYTDASHKIYLNIGISAMRMLISYFSVIDSFMDIVATATVATLIKLEIYDIQTLGDLDSLTLGDMDSVIIT